MAVRTLSYRNFFYKFQRMNIIYTDAVFSMRKFIALLSGGNAVGAKRFKMIHVYFAFRYNQLFLLR